MKKVLFIVFLLLIVPVVSAQSVDEEIENIVYYAEQYEMGDINYLQLMAQATLIRGDINELLGDFKFEEHGPSGVTAEAAEEYFGEPEWYTKRAWDVSEDRDVILDEKVPTFRNTIFDGQRVQLTFNAWPNG